jgi:hypothetical protein
MVNVIELSPSWAAQRARLAAGDAQERSWNESRYH